MKWGWIVFACVLAGWLVARRRRQKRWLQALELVAIAAALLIGLGVVHLPNLEKLLEDVGTALGPWTYLLVGFLAFAETGAFLGFIAPGETAVIVGGLVAGQGKISLLVLIAVVWVCAVLGDITSFELGRRRGRDWLLRHGERLKITEERLEQVERFFEQRGALTIVVGRFLGFVRPLLPFIAGAARWQLRRYLRYDILAAGLWAATFSVLGYVFWHSFDRLDGVRLTRAVRARDLRGPGRRRRGAGAAPARPGEARRCARLARRALRQCGLAARQADRDAALAHRRPARQGRSPTAPRALPSSSFGLELVTALTLLAVGALAFGLLGMLIEEHPVPRIDAWAFDVADPLQTPMLVDVAKVVTALGAFPTVALAALATAIWALTRRGRIDAVALIAGLLLTWVAVHVAKEAYDRPRPLGLAGRDRPLGVSLRPRAAVGHADRLRDRARARRLRLGKPDRGGDGGDRARRRRLRLARLPARPLPHRRARRGRARGGRVGGGRGGRAARRFSSSPRASALKCRCARARRGRS